ncbi:unnamed protein product [Cyprideis torosa]|uniref:Uncharacterized protein n=1 Tax=Cyprideis torosa TaxID=163714 RepID=A0A7R8WFD5_9CRUS|nr:unnamed protein product [Cyprideis torosa]CAG0895316.1 unnamed protein product [Cyprideis torosa]
MNMAFQARHLLSPLDSLGIFSRMDPLCFSNCSGHGDCLNGSCICEVEFDGPGCQEFNRRYFVAFASFFYFISAVSIGQLMVCTYAEFHRSKVPTVKVLFRVTTQKLMHILVFIAAALRAVYFSSQGSRRDLVSSKILLKGVITLTAGGRSGRVVTPKAGGAAAADLKSRAFTHHLQAPGACTLHLFVSSISSIPHPNPRPLASRHSTSRARAESYRNFSSASRQQRFASCISAHHLRRITSLFK